MRRSGTVGAGICSWVFRRHFWQHQRENLFVLVILTLGFLFYVVYGAWTSSVSSSSAVQVEPLQLPADVMVRVPGWAEQVTVPDMDPARLFDPERLADAVRNHPLTEQIPPVYRPTPPPPRVRTIVKALAVRVMTPGGNVEVWGVDEWNQLLLEALPLQAGRWPENAQEVVVHAQFAEDTGVELGDDIPLTYVLPDAAVERQLAVRLVGVYTGDYDLVPSLMLPIAGVQQLTRARRANLIMAWAEPVPDLVVETGRATRDRSLRTCWGRGFRPPGCLPSAHCLPRKSIILSRSKPSSSCPSGSRWTTASTSTGPPLPVSLSCTGASPSACRP